VYSAHNENDIEYPDIDMCIGEPLVWMTLFLLQKKQVFLFPRVLC